MGAVPKILQTSAVGSGATNPSCSLGSVPTKGHTVVVALFTTVAPGGTQAVTDGGTSGSGGWTKLAEALCNGSTNTMSVGIWAKRADGTAGSNVIQGFNCLTLSRSVAFEVEGIDLTQYKTASTDTGASATALTLASGLTTPNSRAEVPLFVVVAMGANGTMTAPAADPVAESITHQAQDGRLLTATIPVTNPLLASGAVQNGGGFPGLLVGGTFTTTARRIGLVVVGFRPLLPETPLLGVT